MFKSVVLFAILAVSAARPGLFHGGHLEIVPAAISHSSRVDYHHTPVITEVHTPLIAEHVVEPIAVAEVIEEVHAPVVLAQAVPAAVSHTSRVDVHHGHHVLKEVVQEIQPIVATIDVIPEVHSVHHHGHLPALSVHPY